MDRLLADMGPRDEVMLVADGRQLAARGWDARDPRVKYFEFPGPWFGNPQRDLGMAHATGDFIMFADDDDNLIQGAIEGVIRPALARAPRRPHVFRIPGVESGNPPTIGHIGGVMFVPPNNKARLASWEVVQYLHPETKGKDSDGYFIQETLKFYPEGPVFHNECIYLVRPHLATAPIQQMFWRGVPAERLQEGMELYWSEQYDAYTRFVDLHAARTKPEVLHEEEITAAR
jgi:hypothetical protein